MGTLVDAWDRWMQEGQMQGDESLGDFHRRFLREWEAEHPACDKTREQVEAALARALGNVGCGVCDTTREAFYRALGQEPKLEEAERAASLHMEYIEQFRPRYEKAVGVVALLTDEVERLQALRREDAEVIAEGVVAYMSNTPPERLRDVYPHGEFKCAVAAALAEWERRCGKAQHQAEKERFEFGPRGLTVATKTKPLPPEPEEKE